MLGGKPTVIPNFLAASTLNELRRLCLLNNLAKNTQHKYFDFQFMNKKWYAFFYEDVEDQMMMGGIKEAGEKS